MTQLEKAKRFKSLHVKGDPVILLNIWDAGTAKAIAETGAKVIQAGAVGINLEDQVVGEDRLYTVGEQCARISYGPGPYRQMLENIKALGRQAFLLS